MPANFTRRAGAREVEFQIELRHSLDASHNTIEIRRQPDDRLGLLQSACSECVPIRD
jgi:hypothetical protein